VRRRTGDIFLPTQNPNFPKNLMFMTYVYILQSELDPLRFYVGLTDDLRNRLPTHNAGKVAHTSKYRPWRLKTYVAFSNRDQAVQFEAYLKSASGRAFSKKRL